MSLSVCAVGALCRLTRIASTGLCVGRTGIEQPHVTEAVGLAERGWDWLIYLQGILGPVSRALAARHPEKFHLSSPGSVVSYKVF